MTRGILDPRTYYYRRVFTDAVRAVEAARAHAAVDGERIAVTGPSQGGGITIAVSGLEPTVDAALPDVPSPTAAVLSGPSGQSGADAGPPAPAASAPAIDLLTVNALNGYMPQPPTAAIGSAAETLYRAATAEDAMATKTVEPVVDGLYQSLDADGLADDLLTASPVAIRL